MTTATKKEWPYQILMKIQSNWNSSSLQVIRILWYNHVFTDLVVSYKIIHIPIIWPSHSISKSLLNRNESICLHKQLHECYQLCQKKQNQMSINRWMYKLWYIHTMKHNSTIKRNKLQIHTTGWFCDILK